MMLILVGRVFLKLSIKYDAPSKFFSSFKCALKYRLLPFDLKDQRVTLFYLDMNSFIKPIS